MFFFLFVFVCSQKYIFENEDCVYLESVNYYVRSDVPENVCCGFEKKYKYSCLEDRVNLENFDKAECVDLINSKFYGVYQDTCKSGSALKCETEEDMKKKLPWDEKKFVELTLDCNESGEKEKIIARADSEKYYVIPPLDATFQFVCNDNGTVQVFHYISFDPLVKEEIPITGCQMITGVHYDRNYIMVSDFDCVGSTVSNDGVGKKVALMLYIVVIFLNLF